MLIAIEIILLFLLLGMSAFFSGSETAFFSLSRFDIQRMSARGLHGAEQATSLLRKPSKLLVAILVGNMLVNISATTLLTKTLIDTVGSAAVPIAVIVMTILVLIFGEITPKVFAVEHNARWARLGAPVLSIVMFATSPVIYFLQLIQKLFMRGDSYNDIRLGEVDLESALELAHSEGAIGEQARDLLIHFLDLERITADKIVAPMSEIPVIPRECNAAEALRILLDKNIDYAFVNEPKGNKFYIVEQDALAVANPLDKAWELADEALMVDSHTSLAALFQQIYGKNRRHVVVKNESGNAVGVAAREDVLTSIFLEPLIRETPDIRRLSRIGRFYIVEGDKPTEDFDDLFGTKTAAADRLTIGEFITEELRISRSGEAVDYENLHFRIIRSLGGKIERVAVKILE
jgi:putative hemolysin